MEGKEAGEMRRSSVLGACGVHRHWDHREEGEGEEDELERVACDGVGKGEEGEGGR